MPGAALPLAGNDGVPGTCVGDAASLPAGAAGGCAALGVPPPDDAPADAADCTGSVPEPRVTGVDELWQAMRAARMAMRTYMPLFRILDDLTQLGTHEDAALSFGLCYRRLMRGPGRR